MHARRLTIHVVLALASAQAAEIARAQPVADTMVSAASARDEDIVITGSLDTRAEVRRFVEGVTDEAGGQIARFREGVCPVSVGLPAAFNGVVVSRLREVAEAAGVPVVGGRCEPNVLVIAAEDSRAFLRRLHRERPILFAGMSAQQRERLLNGRAPVKSWHIVETRGTDGRAMEDVQFVTRPDGTLQYIGSAKFLRSVANSRIEQPTRQDLGTSFIVFDLQALDGRTLQQIADYAAMRSLARTNAAVPGRPSILALFDESPGGRSPPEALTRWDSAYLRALYLPTSNSGSVQQRAAIERSMQRDLGRSPEGEAPASR